MKVLSVLPSCNHLPSGNILVDGYGRAKNYFRPAVTERCNLRCRYCMPGEGLTLAKAGDLLSFEEIYGWLKSLHHAASSSFVVIFWVVRLIRGETPLLQRFFTVGEASHREKHTRYR